MSETSRFFGGSNQYNQPDLAEVLARLLKNGVLPGVGSELAVTESTPAAMSVAIAVGEGWINGFWFKNDAAKTVAIPTAHATLPRIDRIVLRLDTITNLKISIEVKQGTAASVPSAPALTQTAQTYELSLAQVYVGAGVTSITNNKITDERWTNYCGRALSYGSEVWTNLAIPFPFSHPGTSIPAGAKLRIQVGTVTASNVPANGGRVHETVVFPETFTSVLGVFSAPQTAYPHLTMSSPNNITTGNCQITTYNNDTVAKTISSYWVAIGYK